MVWTVGAAVVIGGLLFACQLPRIAGRAAALADREPAVLSYNENPAVEQPNPIVSSFSRPPLAAASVPVAFTPVRPAGPEPDGEPEFVLDLTAEEDAGLALYRSFFSRDRVIGFYTALTGSRQVAEAVLRNADRFEVPVSLAFALAWAESEYNIRAVNRNENSIDRGLFQLNSRSFPRLSVQEFFDPETSARLGLAYLAYCLEIGGNEVVALAMYNAGPNRVTDNGTPRRTLNYIHKILVFREALDKTFREKFAPMIRSSNEPIGLRPGAVSLDIMERLK
jgi:hypothetical protein